MRWLALPFLVLAYPATLGANSQALTVDGQQIPIPTTSEASWLAGMEDAIAAREYEASHNGEGLQAPNRAHNLRTHFEPTGVRVHDRTAPGSPELLGLSLVGLGRGDVLAPVAPGELSNEGARVEIRRPGLVEWYENAPAGLEHGVTLLERPEGEGALGLELSVERAEASLEGERVILRAPSGRRLAYGKLYAVDAEGQQLAAQFAVPEPGRLRIVLADVGAVYPVTLDPLLTETADAQIESDQSNSSFGIAVSGAGDVNGDGYDDVIVGASRYDAGEIDEGAAFVFLGSADGIANGSPATAHAQLESNQANARMASSVSSAGDVNGDGFDDVIVGARWYSAGESREGAAFVFLGSAVGIADGNPATAHAQLESDQIDADLGVSVSSAGDVDNDGYGDVIVGAPGWDYLFMTDEGAAFVFLGSATGIADGNPATAHAQLESNERGAELGHSVSGAGDVNGDGYDDVIVGAYLWGSGDPLTDTDEGAAFVFLGSASGIADGDPSTAHAQLESNLDYARLGNSVSDAGDVNGDGYGDVIVGAYFCCTSYPFKTTDEGAAFVFLGSASGIADGDPSTAHAQLDPNQADAEFGNSVAGAGDVNGDGYADVIVSAPRYDAGEIDEGAVFVFLGSADGITDGDPSTAYAQLESDQADARLGYAVFGGGVSGAGDVNGDGSADVLVGAGRYDVDQTIEGAAFVYLPEPSRWLLLAAGLGCLVVLYRVRVDGRISRLG